MSKIKRSQLVFGEFSSLNLVRCEEGFGHKINDWSPAEWSNAMAGECGEACNLTKKLLRGDDISINEIGKELADVVCYADLVASSLGLDLGTYIVSKFNEVSDRRGCHHRLSETKSPNWKKLLFDQIRRKREGVRINKERIATLQSENTELRHKLCIFNEQELAETERDLAKMEAEGVFDDLEKEVMNPDEAQLIADFITGDGSQKTRIFTQLKNRVKELEAKVAEFKQETSEKTIGELFAEGI